MANALLVVVLPEGVPLPFVIVSRECLGMLASFLVIHLTEHDAPLGDVPLVVVVMSSSSWHQRHRHSIAKLLQSGGVDVIAMGGLDSNYSVPCMTHYHHPKPSRRQESQQMTNARHRYVAPSLIWMYHIDELIHIAVEKLDSNDAPNRDHCRVHLHQ